MTEQEIAQTLTSGRAVDGIEIAEEIVWREYDSEYTDWNDTGEDGNIGRVNDLEQAMVALRVAREVLSKGDFDDDVLQSLAMQVPCEDGDITSIENTVELFQKYIQEHGEREDRAKTPSGPSIDGL